MNKVQAISIFLAIIFVIAGIITFSRWDRAKPPEIHADEIVIWGTLPAETFGNAFSTFEQAKNTRITYVERDQRTFNQKLLEALARREGPDMLFVPGDWLKDNLDKISPANPALVDPKEIRQNYIDLASASFIAKKVSEDGKTTELVAALPLWIDPLVLYWNRNMFNAEGIAIPPRTLDELYSSSNKIKRLGAGGIVMRAGAALGGSGNIPLYKEILSLYFVQLGTDIDSAILDRNPSDNSQAAESAIRFYTDFGKLENPLYTWNDSLSEPRDLFADEKLGLMYDFLSYNQALRLKNPHLAFEISPVPQTKETDSPIYYADIEAITVLRSSKEPDAGWELAHWLADRPQAEVIAERAGTIPARRDSLADKKYSPFLRSLALNARRPKDSHPIISSGLIKDLVTVVAKGEQTISEALRDARIKYERILENN